MTKDDFTYKKAGVNIDAADTAVEKIKNLATSTFRSEVLEGPGGFGAMFALDTEQYRSPVLVTGCDGVGTKLKIAFRLDKHDTIGIDCVAMCANDILAQGASPLFFLDYLSVGAVIPQQIQQVVEGLTEGCRQAGCALIGGETAEMPGFYAPGEYDLAGFIVGVVEKERIIDGSRIAAGDRVIGFPSSGLHSNGYSLVRKVLLEHARLDLQADPGGLGCSLGEELLRPTIIYNSLLQPLLAGHNINGIAHITGGGLVENIPRILPGGTGVELNSSTWDAPAIFSLIQETGSLKDKEMYRTFNMGIGLVLIVPPAEASSILNEPQISAAGAKEIGIVIPTDKNRVVIH